MVNLAIKQGIVVAMKQKDVIKINSTILLRPSWRVWLLDLFVGVVDIEPTSAKNPKKQ